MYLSHVDMCLYRVNDFYWQIRVPFPTITFKIEKTPATDTILVNLLTNTSPNLPLRAFHYYN